jgi:hypothetical protein
LLLSIVGTFNGRQNAAAGVATIVAQCLAGAGQLFLSKQVAKRGAAATTADSNRRFNTRHQNSRQLLMEI